MPTFAEVTFPRADGQRPWPRLSCDQPGKLLLQGVNLNNATGEEVLTNSALHVTGDTDVDGDLQIAGDVGVAAQARVKALQVTDNAQIEGDLRVSGTAETGNLTVTGMTELQDHAQVQGNLRVAGNVHTEGNLRVTGNLTVDGTIQGDIADGSIGPNKLQNNAVGTSKLADNAVTSIKLDTDTRNRVNGALPRSGGTMSGPLVMASALHIAQEGFTAIHYGNRGKLGATPSFNPDNDNNGLWIEGSADGSESGGLFMNGNTLCLWSLGDNDLLRVYDEDDFSSPKFVITGDGSVQFSDGSLQSTAVRVQSGQFGASRSTSGWNLLDGTGLRDFTRQINFPVAFSSTPTVFVSIVHFDILDGQNHRLHVFATNVNRQRFDITFRTWADTRVWGATVNWLAHGA